MPIGESILEKLMEEIFAAASKSTGSLRTWARSQDLFKKGRKKYFQEVVSKCANVRILGMSQPLRTEALYVRVRVLRQIRSRKYLDEQYLEYLNKKKAIPNAIRKELGRVFHDESTDGLQVVRESKHLVILGNPGSGKTTFLRYLAIVALQHRNSTKDLFKRPRVPILISLRDTADTDLSIRKLVLGQIKDAGIPESRQFLKRLLVSGKCLILLDGYDEVPSSRKKIIDRQVKKLLSDFPKNRFIITSRTSEPPRGLDSFTEVQIAEFGDPDIERLVKNWFSELDPKKGKTLLRTIFSDIHLKELSTTPLLLSLLCILYHHDLRIPRNRSELYKRCTECLLREWDTERGFRRETAYERLSDERKMQLLSYIAWKFFSEDKYFFRKKSLEATIGRYLLGLDIPISESAAVLGEVESHHGLLVQKAPDVFSFSHLTFQEYFTARHMIGAQMFGDLIGRSSNPKWAEVIPLAAASLQDASHLVQGIITNTGSKRMDLLAKRGELGYDFQLLKSLVQSDLAISPEVRNRLYKNFIKSYVKAKPFPFVHFIFKWRTDKKSGVTMIRAQLSPRKGTPIVATSLVGSLKFFLEVLSRSRPLLQFLEKEYRPSHKESIDRFHKFISMAEDIINNGGIYDLRLA